MPLKAVKGWSRADALGMGGLGCPVEVPASVAGAQVTAAVDERGIKGCHEDRL
jgi:hypothetical protein